MKDSVSRLTKEEEEAGDDEEEEDKEVSFKGEPGAGAVEFVCDGDDVGEEGFVSFPSP
jgi:hypothetical protein